MKTAAGNDGININDLKDRIKFANEIADKHDIKDVSVENGFTVSIRNEEIKSSLR